MREGGLPRLDQHGALAQLALRPGQLLRRGPVVVAGDGDLVEHAVKVIAVDLAGDGPLTDRLGLIQPAGV